MARIGLTSGFQLVPEGKHIFLITKVTYDEQFGRMVVRMQTEQGITHEERFRLLDDNNEVIEKAMNLFSYFAKVATRNYANREIDTDELQGCYIGATASHTVQPNRNNPEKTITFVNLSDYFEANGFENGGPTPASVTSSPAPAVSPAPSVNDLLSTLGL